jgi:hypothetical protein
VGNICIFIKYEKSVKLLKNFLILSDSFPNAIHTPESEHIDFKNSDVRLCLVRFMNICIFVAAFFRFTEDGVPTRKTGVRYLTETGVWYFTETGVWYFTETGVGNLIDFGIDRFFIERFFFSHTPVFLLRCVPFGQRGKPFLGGATTGATTVATTGAATGAATTGATVATTGAATGGAATGAAFITGSQSPDLLLRRVPFGHLANFASIVYSIVEENNSISY